VQGAIKGYLEASKVLRERDDDEFLHAARANAQSIVVEKKCSQV
jgi:hypothetical protein